MSFGKRITDDDDAQASVVDFTSTLSLDIDQGQRPEERRIPTGFTIADPTSVVEHGRSYQAYRQGAYALPNDGEEQDRLDFQHTIWDLVLDGQLSLAPFSGDPEHVLDIATGTGLWAWEFASRHPRSNVVGTDLSLIQGDRPHITNCTFVREDSEKDMWVWDHKFDYIHARTICTSFTDTRAILRKTFAGLVDGGWIELQDGLMTMKSHDGTHEGTELQRLYETIDRGFRSLGINGTKGYFYKQWLEEIGFVDVVEKWYPAPINSWPLNEKFKMVGKYQCVNMTRAIPAISAKLLPAAGISQAEAQLLISRALEEVKDHEIHGYAPVCVVYGRKPTAEAVKGPPGFIGTE